MCFAGAILKDPEFDQTYFGGRPCYRQTGSQVELLEEISHGTVTVLILTASHVYIGVQFGTETTPDVLFSVPRNATTFRPVRQYELAGVYNSIEVVAVDYAILVAHFLAVQNGKEVVISVNLATLSLVGAPIRIGSQYSDCNTLVVFQDGSLHSWCYEEGRQASCGAAG